MRDDRKKEEEARGETYKVVHVCRAVQKDAGIVSPGNVVERGAVDGVVCAVVEEITRANEANVGRPVPRLCRPLGVGGIAGIPGEACGQIEEAALRDGVLVRVTGVEGKDLPSQATAAGSVVPAAGLQVEDGLGEGEPLRLVGGRVWKVVFGGRHGGECPKGLVVIAGRCGLVRSGEGESGQ